MKNMISLMTIGALLSAPPQMAFAAPTASEARAVASPTALHQADILAAQLLVRLEALRLDGRLGAEKPLLRRLTQNSIASLEGGAALSSFAGGMGAFFGSSIVVADQGSYGRVTEGVSLRNSTGLFALSAVLVATAVKLTASAGQSEYQANELLGLDVVTEKIVGGAVNDMAQVLGLSTENKQRLMDAAREDVIQQSRESQIRLDLGGLAIKMKLIDEATAESYRALAAGMPQTQTVEEMARNLDGLNSEMVLRRIELLKVLRNALHEAVVANPSLGKDLSALALRTDAALAYLQNSRR